MDTGVGVDAYSVIEQGRVSALLEANPAERRLIFEEAAGVSKFKVKAKEALRKLERVDQNLLRVNDVVAEVEKQLRSVKIQAGKARVYQEHTPPGWPSCGWRWPCTSTTSCSTSRPSWTARSSKGVSGPRRSPWT